MIRRSSSRVKSSVAPRLLAFRYRNAPLASGFGASFGNGPIRRVESPSGGSIFRTSAPKSANALPHIAPAGPTLYSTTERSESAPCAMSLYPADSQNLENASARGQCP